jgi:peptidoglycan/xylan/chitin deacetylase (PgdA/CDA1 family)
MNRYPRDMTGYGATPPDPKWPGGARIAVQIVLNYEEGGENNILHGDPASEAFLSEIVGAQPWPGQRHWNMESIYEYGARAGFWRLHRMLRATLPVTVYGVATALARSPDQVAAMQDGGLGNRQPRAEMGRAQGHDRGRGARPASREAIRLHTRSRAAPRAAGIPGAVR